MILADTSLWIDYLGKGDAQMQLLLDSREIVIHPFVIGEIALGHLRSRRRVLSALHALKSIDVAQPHELPDFIERFELYGAGVGYVDVHLLAAALLTPGVKLWSRDRRLDSAARRLGVAFSATH